MLGVQTDKGKNELTGKAIIERLNWRYAVKKFDPARKISETDWAVLEQSLRLAPSSFGLQPYRFIVVTDPQVRAKLKSAASNQSQITEASHLVVIAHKTTLADADIERYIARTAKLRGQTPESLADLEKKLKATVKGKVEDGTIASWTARQSYIALGFLLETAALVGIDAAPMEGFETKRFDEILNLQDYSAAAVCALGYRDAAGDWLVKLPKVRLPEEELFVRI